MLLLDRQDDPPLLRYDNLDAIIGLPETEQWLQWLMHFNDTKIAYEPTRVYVSSHNAEEYRYYYPEGVRTE